MQPRPADLDGAVLRTEREEPRRADDRPLALRDEREVEAGYGARERVVDPGLELLGPLRLQVRASPDASQSPAA